MLQAVSIGQVSSILPWIVMFPFDLAKSSLQIQGELLKSGRYTKLGIVGILNKIYNKEGIRGCYRGFVPLAWLTQINGIRLGLYDYAKQLQLPNIATSAMLGYLSGWLGNPLILIKTRIQCGHNHVGLLNELKLLYQNRMLFKGGHLAALRWGLMSLIQLPTFDFMFQHLNHWELQHRLGISSFMATWAMITLGQPFDIVMTRVYNQDKNIYKGFFQGLLLIIRCEGLSGLFKGYMANCVTFGTVVFIQLVLFKYLKETPLAY